MNMAVKMKRKWVPDELVITNRSTGVAIKTKRMRDTMLDVFRRTGKIDWYLVEVECNGILVAVQSCDIDW